MPRGENPNSRRNLRRLSSNQAREYGSIGGKKSAEVQREISSLRDTIKKALTDEVRAELSQKLLDMAYTGNIRAFELVLKIIGEFPKENVSVEYERIDSKETEELLQELKKVNAEAQNKLETSPIKQK